MFDAPGVSSAGENPIVLESADLNGDGKLDIVRADRNSTGLQAVHVYIGDGAGGLSPATSYDGAADTRDLRLEDVNGDGNPDIVTIGGGALLVFLNDGGGAFPTTLTSGGLSGAQHMDMADLDHDGDLDVCVTEFGTHQVLVMINDGLGNFTLSSSHSLPLPGADIRLAKLNGDDEFDLVVTGNNYGVGDNVFVFLGDGTANFGPRADFHAGAGCTAGLAIARFDNDDHVDVAVATCDGIAVLSGDGMGALGSPTMLTSPTWPAGWASLPAVGDFDGDGRADLVGLVTEPSPLNGVVTVFSYDALGGWEIDGDYDIGGIGGWGAALAVDLDDDGFPDLAVCSANQFVLFAHTALDCNQNGLFDPEEVEDHPLMDANGNGIPDECECRIDTYCQTSPNSVGPGATIGAVGLPSISAGVLVLTAANCPAMQFGVFFLGPGQQNTPFGNGFICVTGPIVRLPVVVVGTNGVAIWQLDMQQFQAGTTRNFQFWYRDPAGGAAFNLTDGLAVTYCE